MRRSGLFSIKILILITIASALLKGCINTGGLLNIKGKVVDERTKTGICWKNVIVQGIVVNDNKAAMVEAGQFSTDSSGNFTYSLRKVKDAYDYNFCFIGSTDYPVTVKNISILELQKDAKYLSFSLSKLADLSIKITRKSKAPLFDTLRLYWESGGVYGGAIYPCKIYNYGEADSAGLTAGRDLVWIGGKVNTTVETKVYADKKTELSWELYRNGRRKEFIDTITCKRDISNIVYFRY